MINDDRYDGLAESKTLDYTLQRRNNTNGRSDDRQRRQNLNICYL